MDIVRAIRYENNKKIGFIYSDIIYGSLAILFVFPFCVNNG